MYRLPLDHNQMVSWKPKHNLIKMYFSSHAGDSFGYTHIEHVVGGQIQIGRKMFRQVRFHALSGPQYFVMDIAKASISKNYKRLPVPPPQWRRIENG
jgi:hypothetical protein